METNEKKLGAYPKQKERARMMFDGKEHIELFLKGVTEEQFQEALDYSDTHASLRGLPPEKRELYSRVLDEVNSVIPFPSFEEIFSSSDSPAVSRHSNTVYYFFWKR